MWAVPVIATAVAFAVGLHLRARVVRTMGPTWDDWVGAPAMGGSRQYVLVALFGPPFAAALYGWPPMPGWLRVTIVGAWVAVCLPFFAEGVRRLNRDRRRS